MATTFNKPYKCLPKWWGRVKGTNTSVEVKGNEKVLEPLQILSKTGTKTQKFSFKFFYNWIWFQIHLKCIQALGVLKVCLSIA